MNNIPLLVFVVFSQAVVLYGSDGTMHKVKRHKATNNNLYPEEQLKQALITHTSLTKVTGARGGFPIIEHVLGYTALSWQEIGKHTVNKVAYKKKLCGGANNLRALC